MAGSQAQEPRAACACAAAASQRVTAPGGVCTQCQQALQPAAPAPGAARRPADEPAAQRGPAHQLAGSHMNLSLSPPTPTLVDWSSPVTERGRCRSSAERGDSRRAAAAAAAPSVWLLPAADGRLRPAVVPAAAAATAAPAPVPSVYADADVDWDLLVHPGFDDYDWDAIHAAMAASCAAAAAAGGRARDSASDGPSSSPGARGHDGEELGRLDLNQLQTALNTAIATENYALAAKIRDVLDMAVGLKSTADGVGDASGAAAGAGDAARGPASWPELGIAGWLADRAEALGLRTPTEVQRRAAPVILGGQDCIVQSETGSGKTLAFLLPLLSMLDYPPAVYPDDLRGPQAAVVVPTRELGVQVAMLAFKLLGGSVNVGVPGARENMFHYDGPRGIKVRGLLLDEELEHAKKDFYLKGVHVVVGTPAMIAAALAPPDPLPSVMQHVKVVAVDEVDACYQDHLEDMQALMDAACASSSCATRLAARPGGGSDAVSAAAASSGSSDGASSSSSSSSSQGAAAGQRRDKPVVVLVGATTGDDLVAAAVQHGWLSEPVVVAVGGRMRVPAGLSHRYVVTEPQRKVAVLCRQIRDDLRQQGDDAPPARAMVFARSEEQARQLSSPLRTALWGDHTLSVLLPQGAEPIKALHSFRDNRTSLLLATPAAARGLDMPAVSHVYNIGPPADATDYLHRAGRAGRIGSPVKGVVTTLVTPDQLPALQAIAGQLGLEMAQAAEPPPTLADPADIEAAKKGLEDMFNLL